MKNEPKVISFTEKILEKAIKKKKSQICPECSSEKVIRTFSLMKIEKVTVKNVPENYCVNCGYEFIDLEIIQAIERVLAEKKITSGQYIIPEAFYLAGNDLKIAKN